MELNILEDELLLPLQEECSKDYISHHAKTPEVTMDELNPFQKYQLNKRFLTAQGLIADVVDYLDHVTNFTDSRDTLLFLLLVSFVLYTIQYFFIYFPLLVILKVMHNMTKKQECKDRELNLKRSYLIIQRVMKDTCELVDFYDLFMRDYLHWGDRRKTILLITEMAKLSITGVSFIYVPLNVLLIIALWIKVLQRSHFFFCLFNVIKEFNRNMVERFLGTRFRNILDPPLEGLIEEFRKEDNGFAKDNFLPFELIPKPSDEDTNGSETDGDSTPFLKKLFRRSTRKPKENVSIRKYSPSDHSLFTMRQSSRHDSSEMTSETPIKNFIKKISNNLNRLTDEIFKDKIPEDSLIDDVREIASQEEISIIEDFKINTSIVDRFASQQKQPRKRLMQVKPKTSPIYREVGEELEIDSSFEVALKVDESNFSSVSNTNSNKIELTCSKPLRGLRKGQNIGLKVPKK
ncbi:unnamed protein product [Moneuplotes crassus]|uniref:Uncharacterized protein n=1 Tax=Euplotes crassus TaxID=5936 RepID=A0AAD1UCU6_EUPCR|nr:unnamed protein product [Moneuplotes crassus]